MANGTTYGITFPFRNSEKGYYFSLTEETADEIRSNLLHLILTRKGTRYYLPDFTDILHQPAAALSLPIDDEFVAVTFI